MEHETERLQNTDNEIWMIKHGKGFASRRESLECLSRKTGQHEKGKMRFDPTKGCHIHQGIISMRTEKVTTPIYYRTRLLISDEPQLLTSNFPLRSLTTLNSFLDKYSSDSIDARTLCYVRPLFTRFHIHQEVHLSRSIAVSPRRVRVLVASWMIIRSRWHRRTTADKPQWTVLSVTDKKSNEWGTNMKKVRTIDPYLWGKMKFSSYGVGSLKPTKRQWTNMQIVPSTNINFNNTTPTVWCEKS